LRIAIHIPVLCFTTTPDSLLKRATTIQIIAVPISRGSYCAVKDFCPQMFIILADKGSRIHINIPNEIDSQITRVSSVNFGMLFSYVHMVRSSSSSIWSGTGGRKV
jgi:hypothetical protein